MFRLIAPVLIGTTLVVPSQAGGQWSTDPSNNLIVGYGLNPELCSDSAGGCYITYEENTGYPRQLILHRLNRYGLKVWGGNGVQIVGQLPEQWFAKIIEDGRGGVLVSYIDDEVPVAPPLPFKVRLRVQRVDSSGRIMWDSAGVRVSAAEIGQGLQSITSDGQGGCLVSWSDSLNILRIQRIDSSGVRVWGDTGVFLANQVSSSSPAVMSSDLAGGSYIAWRYQQMQHIDSNGIKEWAADGISLASGIAALFVDDSRDVHIFGARFDGVTGGIYSWTKIANMISPGGNIIWDSVGVLLDTEKTNYPSKDYSIVVDMDGITHLAWGNDSGDTLATYIQNLRSDGGQILPRRRMLSLSASQKINVHVVAGYASTAIYFWRDSRNPNGVYAQRLDTLGRPLWDSLDVEICGYPPSPLRGTTDGTGGCIVVGMKDDFSIRAQQVSRNGKLGEIITSVNGGNTATPHEYLLFQNYPNPFNSFTIIRYAIPKQGVVVIELYNYLGQKLRTLVDGFHEPGSYQINLDAEPLASGVYFCILRVTGDAQLRKLTILR